jgi:hypothetical protein
MCSQCGFHPIKRPIAICWACTWATVISRPILGRTVW